MSDDPNSKQSTAVQALSLSEADTVWPRGPGPAKRETYCFQCGVPFADSSLDDPSRTEWAQRALIGVNADLCQQCYLNSHMLSSEWFTVRADHEFDVYTYYVNPKHWPHEHNPTVVMPIEEARYQGGTISFDSLTGHEKQLTAALSTGKIRDEYTVVDTDDLSPGLLSSVDRRLQTDRDSVDRVYSVPDYPRPCVFTIGGVYTRNPESISQMFSAGTNTGDQQSLDSMAASDDADEDSQPGEETTPTRAEPEQTTQQTLF